MYRAMHSLARIAIVLCALPPAAAQTQPEMNREANARLSAASAKLSGALNAYRQRLAPDQRAVFDLSHGQWEKYRDSACRFEASGVAGGSAYAMIYADCLANFTNNRLAYVLRLSKCEEGDLSCPAR